MKSKDQQSIEQNERTESDQRNNNQSLIKATLIGVVCGVVFILAAKMVNSVMT